MRYVEHYERLVERARLRHLEEYTEKHHIVPKCLGGGNECSNIVRLLPEEHYLAHQLLVKIHPSNVKLLFAANMMTIDTRGNRVNNKLYKWLRKSLSNKLKGVKRGPPSEESRLKLSKSKMGHSTSDEAREKMRNKFFSIETRAKMSAARRKRITTDETRAKISTTLKKIGMKQEHIDRLVNMNKSRAGIKTSAETLAKLSLIRTGKSPSEETRDKISVALTGKSKSPETIAKMKDAQQAVRLRKRQALTEYMATFTPYIEKKKIGNE